MPNKERNPNKVDRQPGREPAPPKGTGARHAPGDTTDWIEVGHEEAEAQRRTGNAVPATHGQHDAGAGRKQSDPRRVDE